MSRLILASASPRRRELLAQAGFVFEVCPAHIPEEPREGEDPIAYVTRLAREKAERVFRDQGSGVGDLVVLGADTTVTLDGHILEKPRDAEDAARMLRMLSGRTHRVITGVAVVSGTRPGYLPDEALGVPPLRHKDVARMGHGGFDAGPEARSDAAGRTGSAQDDSVLLADRALGVPHLRQTDVARMGHGGFDAGSDCASDVRVAVAAEVTAVRFLTLSDEEIAEYVASGEPMDKAGAYAIQGRAAKWIPRVEGCYFNVVGLPLALVAGMLERQGTGIREQGSGTRG